ncbi:PfkB family carbohydrate kinase [Okibacterium endophyticum]
MTGRLVYTGNVIVDIVVDVDRIPEPGGDTIAGSSEVTAGGGYNVMIAAARDGADVLYAGQYGAGIFGGIVRSALADAGFDLAQPGLDDVDSGYSIVIVDETAERTFITHVGAEGRLDATAIGSVAAADDDIVVVSGYSLAHPVNAAALPGWLDTLPERTKVVLDPSPLVAELPPDVLERVLSRTDVLTANAREMRLLAGSTGPADLALAAAEAVQRLRRGGTVLARDGAAGCIVADGSGETRAIAGFPVDPIDTTGAGDAHTGVLVAALLRGEPLADAVRRANAAAAVAVSRRGPATAPTAAETDRLLDTAPR